ncbi:hypothetical protein ABIC88_002807 [Pseudomonas kilonensis]
MAPVHSTLPAIASKLCSHRESMPNTSFLPTEDPVWERACPRWRWHIQHPGKLTHRYREQARSHRGSVPDTNFLPAEDPMWERACPRWRWHIQHPGKLTHRYREQARSHRGSVPDTNFLPAEDPMWERACPRWRWHIQHPGKLTRRYREQALLPQRDLCQTQISCPLKIQCGSELARDGGGTSNIQAS